MCRSAVLVPRADVIRRRTIQPWVHDPRGNAVPIDSLNHIHHPDVLYRIQNKWFMMAEKLVASKSFGIREPLSMLVKIFQYGDEKCI